MKNKQILFLFVLLSLVNAYSQEPDSVRLDIIDGEYWWGGLNSQGYKMPYGARTHVSYDLWGDNKGNQAQPLLLSSTGRYIWSENPIKYSFENGASHRTVVLPDGPWKGDDGKIVKGNQTIEIETPLERIPHFTRVK